MLRSLQSRRSGAGAPEINLAPLIDMVFILLLFFLVTTTLVKDTGFHVERPRAVHGESVHPAAFRASIAASGSVYAEGKRVDLETLAGMVADYLGRRGDGPVILIPDESTPSGRLVEVLDAVKGAGAASVAIAARKAER